MRCTCPRSRKAHAHKKKQTSASHYRSPTAQLSCYTPSLSKDLQGKRGPCRKTERQGVPLPQPGCARNSFHRINSLKSKYSWKQKVFFRVRPPAGPNLLRQLSLRSNSSSRLVPFLDGGEEATDLCLHSFLTLKVHTTEDRQYDVVQTPELERLPGRILVQPSKHDEMMFLSGRCRKPRQKAVTTQKTSMMLLKSRHLSSARQPRWSSSSLQPHVAPVIQGLQHQSTKTDLTRYQLAPT